ncbi:MAG: hypothetical protein JXB04_07785 [Kiritimatiellae bacterium]|nr:hypothetical protein [Kiritimatiellia bacterium]
MSRRAHKWAAGLWVTLLLALRDGRAEETPGNLAPNASFEAASREDATMPARWQVFSDPDPHVALSTGRARSGQKALRFTALGRRGGHQCCVAALPVAAGKKYSFGVHVRNDKDDKLDQDTKGLLSIEWLDPRGLELSRMNSDGWSSDLSVLRWTFVSTGRVNPPHRATRARFVIHLCEEGRGGKGSYYADDALILEE